MIRCEVIKLYRQFMRTIRKIPDEKSRAELRDWVRHDFKNNKHHSDEMSIKMMMQHGQKALRELKTGIDFSK